ncbi:pilus assembly protein TadG-related protein [Frigidibacter sp. RF13]|uniref:pilus assembly protein TadG-related protein n=1 Tax=Frigidibacter sp. RF13 TaxID=2997340 RepID=UPI002271E509|nr:pilus assembly protein TadG-related protein [Frigidibacter sp. RF13]MCY1127264.1 pilus assembly protein TadG-related protein [Frigidibacter sp. RF13]
MFSLRKSHSRFRSETEGSMTVYGIFIFLTMGCLVGLTLDVANAYKARSEIQVAADAAAHAALLLRLKEGNNAAISKAVAVANHNLSLTKAASTTITASDITFGQWDRDTRHFTPHATPVNAVRVMAGRTHDRNNSLGTIFLGMSGLDAWDINVATVMETYRPPCLREGFVADQVVDIQSNNRFGAGFCVHSNDSIKINQNNVFEAGTIVSMPSLDDLQVSASGFVKNDGLVDALRESFYKIRIINRITDINDALRSANFTKLREMTAKTETSMTGGIQYLTNSTTHSVDVGAKAGSGKDVLSPADLNANAVNIVSCSSKGRLDLEPGAVFSNLAILTDCAVDVRPGVTLKNMILSTTSTDTYSIQTPSGNSGGSINFGDDDGCEEGGGAHLVTLGGIKTAANLNVYGSQFLAAKDIQFAANADGLEGISLISGGKIDSTSNIDVGFCGTGMGDNFEIDYFRLAL